MFRSLGVGKKTYEDTIAAEMAQLTAAIEELGDTSFSPVILFEQAIANIICTVVFGTQYKYSDQEFSKGILVLKMNQISIKSIEMPHRAFTLFVVSIKIT